MEAVMLVAVCVEEEEVGLGEAPPVAEDHLGQTEAVADKGEAEDKVGNDNQVSHLKLQLQLRLLLQTHPSPLQLQRLRTCLSSQLNNQ